MTMFVTVTLMPRYPEPSKKIEHTVKSRESVDVITYYSNNILSVKHSTGWSYYPMHQVADWHVEYGPEGEENYIA